MAVVPSRPVHPPLPPFELPPARTVAVPGRGEFFVRDSALAHPNADPGPAVLLLHGWMVTADLNWGAAYEPLAQAGYRVLALDHRGHGRGIRPMVPFRLADCAADAAAVLRALDAAPAIVVGYSMGGTIAQLIARDHREVAGGLVLSGTCQHFQDAETRRVWKLMGLMGFLLGLAPRRVYRAGFRRSGFAPGAQTAWILSELMRHQSRDVAEAGRELGRFDSRPWLASMARLPAAMVLTARDTAVSPAKQRELAEAIGAEVFQAEIDHLDLIERAEEYNPQLLRAVQYVRDRAKAPAAA
ncbi:MAG: alpha/beta fold hydrolase [Solirubrobacteraceae bacterium]